VSRVGMQAARSVHALYLAERRAAPGWAQCAVYHLQAHWGGVCTFTIIAGVNVLPEHAS